MKKLLTILTVLLLFSCSEDEELFKYERFEIDCWDMQERPSHDISFGNYFDDVIIKIYDDKGNCYPFIDGGYFIRTEYNGLELTLNENSIFDNEDFTECSTVRCEVYLITY